MLLRNELLSRGVTEDRIIYLNLESMQYSDLDDAKKLYSFIKQKINTQKKIISYWMKYKK